MSVEFDRGSPGKFDSRTLNRETLNRWTGSIDLLAGSAGQPDGSRRSDTVAVIGRGNDTVGNPHRAQISQFHIFELIPYWN